MSDGELSGVDTTQGGYTSQYGAAVFMDDPSGVVEISGGTIENCKAELGGAVYMTAGTFEMSGDAKIKNCTATNSGGAVYLGGGTLTVSGGSITNNYANNGAGVFLADGTINITGGQVSEKIATINGGGAYLGGGTMTISGATAKISQNEAINGAGVYLGGGLLAVSDEASMTGNIASSAGGGAYVSGGTLIVSGGQFQQNNAAQSGGGAYVTGGDVIVYGGAFLALGGFTMLIEYFLHITFDLPPVGTWSLYPLAVLGLLGLTLILIGSSKPLRESLERKFFL